MKLLFVFVLDLLLSSQIMAQPVVETPEVLADRAKYAALNKAAQQEAEKLSTKQVYEELERLHAAAVSRMVLNPGTWGFDPAEFQRTAAFGTVLDNRRKQKEVAASFYYGIQNYRYCQGLQKSNNAQLSNQIADCWRATLDSFKVASAANVGAATFNIARMYDNGFGVIASKFAAADWYVKSAEQYRRESARDEALTSLEAALTAVPDHPAALRLRKVMLK